MKIISFFGSKRMNKGLLKRLIEDDLKVIVYGAGFRGEAIVRTLLGMEIECIAVVDKDPQKQGGKMHGIPIISLSDLNSIETDFYILVSVAGGDSICEELSHNYQVFPIEAGDLVIRLSYVNCEAYGYNSIENIGSYMSPYPDANHLVNVDEIKGIDFNMEVQEQFFNYLVNLYKTYQKPYPNKGRRYYEENTKYGEIDALVLHGVIKKICPQKIIEVGSGFSSAIMLDTNEFCMNNSINLQFVEPYPDRLKGLLKQNDKIKLYESFLQDVDKSIFSVLEANDILFIDSSHMSKMGSDVNEIFFDILPSLKSGVYIHFHDVFKNFDYPLEWIKNGWAWNEAYLLRAFLMNNKDYEIVFFCDMWNEAFENTGLFNEFVAGANLWIRKK